MGRKAGVIRRQIRWISCKPYLSAAGRGVWLLEASWWVLQRLPDRPTVFSWVESTGLSRAEGSDFP